MSEIRLIDLSITHETMWKLAELNQDKDIMDIAVYIGEELYSRAYEENPRLPWISAYNYDEFKENKAELTQKQQ